MTSKSQLAKQVYSACTQLFKRSDGAKIGTMMSARRGSETSYDLNLHLADDNTGKLYFHPQSPEMFSFIATDGSRAFVTRTEEIHDQPTATLEHVLRLLQGAYPYPPPLLTYWYYEGKTPIALVTYVQEDEEPLRPEVFLPSDAKRVPRALKKLEPQTFWKLRDENKFRLCDGRYLAKRDDRRIYAWCGTENGHPPARMYFNWGTSPFKAPAMTLTPAEQEVEIQTGRKFLAHRPYEHPRLGNPFK